MEQDKRSEPRLEINTVVEVEYPEGAALRLETHDLSDHGAYLRATDGISLPPPGSVIQVRATGLFGEKAKAYAAEVISQRNDGIGIRFL